jgi:predicted ATPase
MLATNAVRIGNENGLTFATILAEAHVGFARVAAGDHAGLDEIRTAIERYRASRQAIALPNLLAGLVQANLVAGRIDESFPILADARATIAATGERIFTPELHRLEGELHGARGAIEEAEACFRRAVDAAVAQGTRSWELRARLSLARLLLARGDRPAVCATVRPIVDFQTEGLDMPDLQEARALLAAP